ncbi:Crp/Fnr family transcriptional regulator [Nitrosomonas sp. Nm166]|uniref:Crp/Fnr family transcriptional regulator n=1 Tax=Nitrosomonas sp. Nm166 TaxID=1881054 RepID=UPI0015A60FFB|nr:Crp/Fnr family transcriptional regulator [Nitrosomonas sp. Nm166]
MSRAEVLFEAYEKLQYVYFPVTATASLLCWLEDGTTVEVAMVGNEGILGVSALMGREESFTQVIVSQPGHGYRVSIKSLQKILARSGGRRTGILKKVITRYNQTLLIQMAQATACSRRHLLEQQLCTWLLSCFERGHSNTLIMTQESISYALGVRRESITEAAKKLQDSEIITYRRGYIELKNKTKLEARACECYKILGRELVRLKSDLESFRNLPGLKLPKDEIR